MTKKMSYLQLYRFYKKTKGSLVGVVVEAYRIPPGVPERNPWDSPFVGNIWLETKSSVPREYHENGSLVVFLENIKPTRQIQYANVILGEKTGRIMLNDLRFRIPLKI